MKTVSMLMGMILTSPLAFGSSEIYQCSGVVKSYSTDDQQSIRLVMDTSKMIITILGDDGIPSSYAITSSQRSRSYMIGTQFIEAKKDTGTLQLEMPWTRYYGPQPIRLSLKDASSSSAGGDLECDKSLYDGPGDYVSGR